MSSVASILAGTPAGIDAFARAGSAVIPLGAAVIAVPDTRITANSVVVCWGIGAAADGTAKTFAVDVVNAGVGFSIVANANTTAAKTVGYCVLSY